MRGEWNTNTPYYVNEDHIDVVTYLGDAYYCKETIETTGNSNPQIDTTLGTLHRKKGSHLEPRANGMHQPHTSIIMITSTLWNMAEKHTIAYQAFKAQQFHQTTQYTGDCLSMGPCKQKSILYRQQSIIP